MLISSLLVTAICRRRQRNALASITELRAASVYIGQLYCLPCQGMSAIIQVADHPILHETVAAQNILAFSPYDPDVDRRGEGGLLQVARERPASPNRVFVRLDVDGVATLTTRTIKKVPYGVERASVLIRLPQWK